MHKNRHFIKKLEDHYREGEEKKERDEKERYLRKKREAQERKEKKRKILMGGYHNPMDSPPKND